MDMLKDRTQEYPFLRTRRKRSAAPKVESEVAALTAPETPVAVKQRSVRQRPESHNLRTPVFHGNTELSLKNPVVRLDKIQSGIGSMSITGAQAFAWEDEKLLSGIKVMGGVGDSVVEPPMYGNRSLVEFEDGKVIMNMRHSHKMRRLVVASASSDLYVNLYDGSQIFAPMDFGNNALVIYRVGNEFEMRLEKINTTDLLAAFGIIPSQVVR